MVKILIALLPKFLSLSMPLSKKSLLQMSKAWNYADKEATKLMAPGNHNCTSGVSLVSRMAPAITGQAATIRACFPVTLSEKYFQVF